MTLRFACTNDQAYDLVIAVASGEVGEVSAIAEQMRAGTRPW